MSLCVKSAGIQSPLLEGGVQTQVLQELDQQLIVAHQELMTERGKSIGFYDLGEQDDVVDQVMGEARRLRTLADDLLVLGIGGSSLGGQALIGAMSNRAPLDGRVHFIDNVDPDTLALKLDSLDPQKTAVLVITKSGGTVETLAQFLIARAWLRAAMGLGETRQRLVAITDPEKGFLREIAQTEGLRTLSIPQNVGGRFSVLTPVGLLPAAFVGLNIKELLSGAKSVVDGLGQPQTCSAHAFARSALATFRHCNAKSIVLMPYTDALRLTSSWFVQLWAESLGKKVDRRGQLVHTGQTPIPALGATDQHAQVQLFVEGPKDKVICMIHLKNHHRKLVIPEEWAERSEVDFLLHRDLSELLQAEARGTRAALLEAKVPVFDLEIDHIDERNFGALVMTLQCACALFGQAIGIHPFDQPGVEAGKRMAFGLLGRKGYAEELERVKRFES